MSREAALAGVKRERAYLRRLRARLRHGPVRVGQRPPSWGRAAGALTAWEEREIARLRGRQQALQQVWQPPHRLDDMYGNVTLWAWPRTLERAGPLVLELALQGRTP